MELSKYAHQRSRNSFLGKLILGAGLLNNTSSPTSPKTPYVILPVFFIFFVLALRIMSNRDSFGFTYSLLEIVDNSVKGLIPH